MSKNPGPNKKNLDHTNKLFLSKAKAEFVKYGYGEASTNRIVEQTGMARGSLYYHFGDKKGLFTAVYTNLLNDIGLKVQTRMDAQDDHWQAMLAGIECYLEHCLNKGNRRIILEAYKALNYRERVDIQRQTLLGKMEELILILKDEGYFKGHDPQIVSVFIYGMITETGRSFEILPDAKAALPHIVTSARAMLTKMAQ